MIKELSLQLPPEIAYEPHLLQSHIFKQLGIQTTENTFLRLKKRSIDARNKPIKVNTQVEIFLGEPPTPIIQYSKPCTDVSQKPQAIIVGAGPAGMFAALRLIELGIKPVIVERGKDVRSRRRDLAAINKEHLVNENSNYCFGEGGAGTYSDGKLYTRSNKRGDIRRILEIFVAHGAVEDILVEAHPHIGTNKLPKIVQNLRESILNAGGEIYFETRVTDFILKNREILGVITHRGQELRGVGVILATGHSARDIFQLLQQKNIHIEPKPFALGVRVEHSQELIDKLQYHGIGRGNYLPAAAYSLVTQVSYKNVKRGVFSFCMCPGGFIVPAATAQGEVVVNGMSPSKRNSEFANSGIVVSVEPADFQKFAQYKELAGMYFQQSIEQTACKVAGNSQKAPAQRLQDFVNGKISTSLLKTSYQPGLESVDMQTVLPDFIAYSLRQGFKDFGKKMKGYLTNEAQIIGVESRTSSPVRIPRNKQTFEHLTIQRLFPCGEGAGYAGGIMSAAIDGERCAEKLVEKYAYNYAK
ncbi:MAG: FAD-dependent monooxygenase [Microscillaceae bacterium]|nr:FAD-dependent monooxygenase [Microscillaceae bacterium]MDW8459930.1 FAD-dependent monooxygenase [Cytophagales bacterium]